MVLVLNRIDGIDGIEGIVLLVGKTKRMALFIELVIFVAVPVLVNVMVS